MGEHRAHHQPLTPSAVLRRLERMVHAGRMGEDDAAPLRAAAESGGLDEAVGENLAQHADARVAKLWPGAIREDEAGDIVARRERGEDARDLLRGLRGGPQSAEGMHRDDGEEPDGG